MSDRNVSTDALRTAARALTEYMNAVNDDLEKMHDAVIDCSDNMAHDVYSQKAIIKVEECNCILIKGTYSGRGIERKDSFKDTKN